MEAVALVKIRASVLASRLQAGGPSGTTLLGANGEPLNLRPLDDATLVFTGISLREVEHDDLALLLRTLLGDVLDTHDDERGILFFPQAAVPKAATYAAAIDEVAEMGEWTPLVEPVADDDGGFADLAGNLMGQLGPDIVALQQRMMAGDPAAMQEAMAQVGQIMADPEKRDALMKAMSAMTGPGSPLAGMADHLGPGVAPPGGAPLDLEAIQAQAKKMMADNPQLEADLMASLQKPGSRGPKEG